MAMSAEKSDAARIDIRNLDAFSAPNRSNSTFRGVVVVEGPPSVDIGTGRLFYSPEELEAFNALKASGELAYVVYSYATPIAWADRAGNKTLTELDHSATTKRHKAIVKAAWNL